MRRRFLAALGAVLMAWLGWLALPTTAAAVPVLPTATHGCDGHHHSVRLLEAATQRGPPGCGHTDATPHDAVDLRLHGASPRFETVATDTWTYDYNTHPQFALADGIAISTAPAPQGQVSKLKGDLSSLGLSRVAANAGDDVVRALSTGERRTLDDALRPDKLDHVFDPKHNFDPLVQQFGSREAAMEQIVRNIGGPLPQAGRFEVARSIGGQTVIIRGAVVDGIPRIGTAFTP